MFKKKKMESIEIDPLQVEIDRLAEYLHELPMGSDEYETITKQIEILMKAKALRDNDLEERARQDTIRAIKTGLAYLVGMAGGGVVKYIIIQILKTAVFK